MKLKIDLARYHRNGIMGQGFTAVAFRWRMQGERKERRFVATVFEETGACAVIEPDNLHNRWRGDDFEPFLRAAIATVEKSGELYERDGSDN